MFLSCKHNMIVQGHIPNPNSKSTMLKVRIKKRPNRRPPTMTIDEIAERSGFNSISTFHQIFLKQTGMTPLQFKKIAQR
ncbi:AraC family transcriptional regulator [Oscillospiraceae bacterium N12]|uniref:AraC family transcriptional regulator n=1 Tax=Jilunia laotingensis TaxID=2763675 RepID=A0A926F1E6_9BACT|nr:AraC family transcriptional regulator [Jilunia laotingensis]